MIKKLNLNTDSRDATISLGRVISRSLGPGSGVLLSGDLGAGKTTLIQGICRGLGVTENVKSPTFVIECRYQGELPVHHVDLYRLSSALELENAGWEEMADEEGVYLVEWADRFPLPFTAGALRVGIEYGESPDGRVFEIAFDDGLYPTIEKDLREYDHPGI
jgi:tRNA threonylcarbamoyladenosine biosynthesis protein TsaE